jgi:hypothetical protein
VLGAVNASCANTWQATGNLGKCRPATVRGVMFT